MLTMTSIGKTYLKPGLPPLHYALCGCEDMPGYPQKWGGK